MGSEQLQSFPGDTKTVSSCNLCHSALLPLTGEVRPVVDEVRPSFKTRQCARNRLPWKHGHGKGSYQE